MKFYKFAFLSFLGIAALSSCSDDDVSPNDGDTESYTADLSSLNGSGASGTFNIEVNDEDDTFTVTITASGMTPDRAHAQHIHGSADDDDFDATCPDMSADEDGNGIVSVPEGAPFYGAILIPLEDFPTADADGNIDFTQTYDLGDVDTGDDNEFNRSDLGDLTKRAVVLHGMMVNGQYNGMTPVACGTIDND